VGGDVLRVFLFLMEVSMSFLCGFGNATTQFPSLVALGNAEVFLIPEVDEAMESFSPAEPVWAGIDAAAGNLRMNGLLRQAAADGLGALQKKDVSPASTSTTLASSAADQGIFHLNGVMHPALTDLAVVVGIVALWEGLRWFACRKWESSPENTLKSFIDAHAKGLSENELRFLRAYTAAPSKVAVYSDFWHPATYAKRIERSLNDFLASTPQLSDDFFKICLALVTSYAEQRPRPDEHLRDPWIEASFMQIHYLISNERIVTDRRFRNALEKAAKIYEAPPVKDDLFTEGYGRGLKLKQGVTVGLLDAIGRLSFNDSLWDGKFGKVFFTSLANVVKVLSRDHPEQAQRAKDILLRDCWRNQYAKGSIEWTLRDIPIEAEAQPVAAPDPVHGPAEADKEAPRKAGADAAKGNGGRRTGARALD